MRLTTRKTDAFTDTETEMLTLIASEGTAWFLPGISRKKRDALSELERLGHIGRSQGRKPADAPRESKGYRLTDHGRNALAEVIRRKKAS